ncbi:MAG: hypothetical protein IJO97_05275 [Lachnospiraceae bacterium]|nr:hypothetical protein [Lachnospiraceae bacterium]
MAKCFYLSDLVYAVDILIEIVVYYDYLQIKLAQATLFPYEQIIREK